MLITEFRLRMAPFRVSHECLDHCVTHYTLDILEMAAEAYEDIGPLTYVADPDLTLLDLIEAITGRPFIRMPQYIKPRDALNVKKSTPEYAATQIAKLKALLDQVNLNKRKNT